MWQGLPGKRGQSTLPSFFWTLQRAMKFSSCPLSASHGEALIDRRIRSAEARIETSLRLMPRCWASITTSRRA
jgi:hypothetical protein